MHYKLGLDEPARQAYLRYAGDGIADLIIGSAFFGIGLMMLSDMPFVPAWIFILLLPVNWALKRVITVPRLNWEELKRGDSAFPSRQQLLWVTLAGVLFLSAVVLLTALNPGWPDGLLAHLLSWSVIGASIAIVLLVTGLILHAWRWAVYAFLIIPAMYLVTESVIDFPTAIAGLGALIFLSGALLAARFIASNPRLVS